jgi:hypothetical protein
MARLPGARRHPASVGAHDSRSIAPRRCARPRTLGRAARGVRRGRGRGAAYRVPRRPRLVARHARDGTSLRRPTPRATRTSRTACSCAHSRTSSTSRTR